MENNITQIFKAITFMNKKTLLPDYDDNIIIEEGCFIIQDSNRTYYMHIPMLNNIANNRYVMRKEDFLNIKTKNAKYFLKEATENSLVIEIKTKNDIKEMSVPIALRGLNHVKIMEKEFACNNLIEINGIAFKELLDGFKDEISLRTEEDSLFITVEGSELNFKEAFGEMCLLEVKQFDKSVTSIMGQAIIEGIGQLGLTKKNNKINLLFNEICLKLQRDNIVLVVYSNK